MPLHIIHDPEAEKRSVMSQRVPTCNGHKNGLQCEHYWFVRANIQPMQGADTFKEGERLRRCLLVAPVQNLDYKDLATECTQYKPSTRPYDANQEKYEPLTDEEITALQEMYEAHKSVGTRQPFLAELALQAYKKLAAEHPDDPQVVAIRARAAEQSADLDRRRKEGEEARRRNLAEAEERARREAEEAAERLRKAADKVTSDGESDG